MSPKIDENRTTLVQHVSEENIVVQHVAHGEMLLTFVGLLRRLLRHVS